MDQSRLVHGRHTLQMPDSGRILLDSGANDAEVVMLSGAVITTILQVRDGSTALECYRDRLGLE